MVRHSFLDIFADRVEKRGHKTAALAKRDGVYTPFTWAELGDEVRAVSRGLLALGVAPGDRVAILAGTSLCWVHCDLGIVGAGAVTVPIYPSNVADECQYILDDSGTLVAFAEDAGQVQKLRAERHRLPGLRRVVQLCGKVEGGDEWVMSYADFATLGTASVAALTALREGLSAAAIATILYTSGTTGRPKGVVLTHEALLYEAESIAEIGVALEDDCQFLFLPLAHSLGKVLMIAWLATGHVVAFAENVGAIMQNLAEVKPTMMGAVPRIFEKVYAAVVQKGLAQGGVKAKLFRAALEACERHGTAELEGTHVSPRDAIEYAALRRVVFARVAKGLNEALGGRMRLMISGGAPLAPRISWFFRDAGLMILEGYGLTESSAATTVNRPKQWRIGTVGLPMSGTVVRIAADGEVLIKGKGLMRGYWQNPAATSEALDGEGFLHTGDIGTLDASGFLRITDRKKDIIITAGGKNVAPQNIENLLKANPLVSQAVVHGDRRKFLSALVTLDAENLKKLALVHNLARLSYAELTQHPSVKQAVAEIVADVNAQLASYETIKCHAIVAHDFSVESGELTPSLKVKRKVINERYAAIFDGFYLDDAWPKT